MLWEQNKGYYFLSCCTDVGNKVLDLCQRNIERNLLELDTTGNILVRELNWAKPCCTSSKQSSSCYYSISLTVFPFHILCLHLSVSSFYTVPMFHCVFALLPGGKYSWSEEDWKVLQNTTFILAADGTKISCTCLLSSKCCNVIHLYVLVIMCASSCL